MRKACCTIGARSARVMELGRLRHPVLAIKNGVRMGTLPFYSTFHSPRDAGARWGDKMEEWGRYPFIPPFTFLVTRAPDGAIARGSPGHRFQPLDEASRPARHPIGKGKRPLFERKRPLFPRRKPVPAACTWGCFSVFLFLTSFRRR